MFKFIIFAAYIVITSAGIIHPSIEHDHGLHHHGLSLPTAHADTILEHDHHHIDHISHHITHHDHHHLSGHGPIIKVAVPSAHATSYISHHPIAISAAPAAPAPLVKVPTPIVKYIAQPIIKIAPEPILLKSYVPHHQHHHVVQHAEPLHHLHKVAAIKVAAAPLPHHHHHHTLSVPVPVPIHTSPIVVSAPAAVHHATLPLVSHHHGHHLNHHEFLH